MAVATNDLASVRSLRSRLWKAGFRPVPVYNAVVGQPDSGKRPHGVGWQNAARANPPACTRMPVSPAATNTGILCDGFRVIDIDIEDDARASEAERIAADLLGLCLVRFRANSGKRALLYRAAEGEPAKRSIIGEHGKVEILGRGQQFVAFGLHFTGAPLEWRGGEPGELRASDLSTVSEEEIGEFLAAIRDIVGAKEITEKPISERASAASQARKEIIDIGARERAAFEKALMDECTKVATAGEGMRNDTLNTAAFNLSQMAAAGWGSAAEVSHSLMCAARDCGLPANEAARTIRSGMEAGAQKPRPPLADRNSDKPVFDASPLINGHAHAEAVSEAQDGGEDDDSEDDAEDEAPPLDDDLTRVGGILGDVIEAIVRSSRRPNRRMALAAALPIVGTLVGRRLATPTRSGTHLYVIVTGPSAIGKQHQLDAIERLMGGAGLSRHVGPSSFMSLGAVNRFVEEKPLSICPQDEFGAVLAKISNRNASGHETAISAVLRMLWNTSFGIARTPAYATSRSVEIKAPALSLFAPTTAEELYAALKGRDMMNGFMNRFTIIDSGPRTAEIEPKTDLRREAELLAPKLQRLYFAGSPKRGNLAGLTDKNGDPDPEPIPAQWATQSVHDDYLEFSEECLCRIDADPEFGVLYGRTAEMAQRIATIRACGDDPEAPVVNQTHFEWAARLAISSAEATCRAASKHMVDPLGAAEFERKLLQKIAASGGTIKLRKLHRSMQRHVRYAGDLEKTINALQSAGLVKKEKMVSNSPTGHSIIITLT